MINKKMPMKPPENITSLFLEQSTFHNLAEVLTYRAKEQPNDLAYTFLNNEQHRQCFLTYSHLHERAKILAGRIQRQAQQGDTVVLLYPTGIDFIVAFFSCLYAGVIAVCVDPPRNSRTSERILKITQESQARLLITNDNVFAKHQALMEKIQLQECSLLISDIRVSGSTNIGSFQPVNVTQNDLCFLQYTSGSTNAPKGVMVSHKNILATLHDLDIGFEHTSNSCMVTWLPFFHDMGLIYGLLQPIYSGFPCYFMAPVSFLQRPIRWLAAIDKYQATHTSAPNFAYQLCVDTISNEQVQLLDLRCWQVALNGAEPVRADALEKFSSHFSPAGFSSSVFCPGYGMAEATLKITATEKHKPPTYLYVDSELLSQGIVVKNNDKENKHRNRILVSNGKSHINASIKIVDPATLIDCDDSRTGEIWVSSDTVAQGYFYNEEATKETFNAYLASGEGPFLRTGDRGFLYQDELYITGRIVDLMIIRGRNHHPEDVELTAQESHPALRPAHGAAFAIDVRGASQLVVVNEIQRTYLRRFTASDVIANVREAVAFAHDLGVYAVVLVKPGSISKTTSGKIQRKLCRDRFIRHDLAAIAHCGRYVSTDTVSNTI